MPARQRTTTPWHPNPTWSVGLRYQPSPTAFPRRPDETVVLIHRLPAWGQTLRARAVASPKVHVVDTGLAGRLLGLSDAKLARNNPAALPGSQTIRAARGPRPGGVAVDACERSALRLKHGCDAGSQSRSASSPFRRSSAAPHYGRSTDHRIRRRLAARSSCRSTQAFEFHWDRRLGPRRSRSSSPRDPKRTNRRARSARSVSSADPR